MSVEDGEDVMTKESVELVHQETEELEGSDDHGGSWGDYPIDDLLIRHETRTIQDVIRRINQKRYVMDPDFQREFIWQRDKQSKLIESVIMRIPLPVFYVAEDNEGRMVVVDGLQRLSTFQEFVKDRLVLHLPDRNELNKKKFSDLSPKLKNRVEDCNLIFYIIDSKVPERARLDIFERVNGGVPLSRQQMRNCLFMGPATRFLKEEAQTESFLKVTGKSLKISTMRDREFVNRFCAFKTLGLDAYNGNMDDFLANCLRKMNEMGKDGSSLSRLSNEFRRSLENNFLLFEQHAFRRSGTDTLAKELGIPYQSQKRAPINASLWDVMSTGLSFYTKDRVEASAEPLRDAVHSRLLTNMEFEDAITSGTSDTKKVKCRFQMTQKIFREILGAHAH